MEGLFAWLVRFLVAGRCPVSDRRACGLPVGPEHRTSFSCIYKYIYIYAEMQAQASRLDVTPRRRSQPPSGGHKFHDSHGAQEQAEVVGGISTVTAPASALLVGAAAGS